MAILNNQKEINEFLKKEPQPVLKTKPTNVVPKIPILFPEATHIGISVVFIFEGKEYEVSKFDMGFSQFVDHKGQPQDEVRGGAVHITLTQTVPQEIYKWAMTHSGKDISLAFRVPQASSPLKMELENAFCISFERHINEGGLTTDIVISPNGMRINDIPFHNHWA